MPPQLLSFSSIMIKALHIFKLKLSSHLVVMVNYKYILHEILLEKFTALNVKKNINTPKKVLF